MIFKSLYFFLPFLMLLSWESYCQSKIEPNVELMATLGGINHGGDSTDVIYISTTITNYTLDTVRFISMSCSHYDFYKVGNNTNYLVKSKNDCYSNVPYVIELLPFTRIKQFIEIVSENKTVHKEKLKIGFQFIRFEERDELSLLYENRLKIGKTIWSNTLDLEELYGTIKKIPVFESY